MHRDINIIGASDATLVVAEASLSLGVPVRHVLTISPQFSISYSKAPIKNHRAADVPKWAAAHGVPVTFYTDYDQALRSIEPGARTLCLVAGWYHVIPRRFREAFDFGCLGFHASLLPRLRGGAPLNWAILSGMSESGVTLFQMSDGVDDGDIYAQESFAIEPRATIADLVAASLEACSALVRKNLAGILSGEVKPHPQVGTPSYSLQRNPEDGRIDWRRPSENLDRLIRAVTRPYPGAFSELNGNKLMIWAASPLESSIEIYGAPGQIARIAETDYPCVITGSTALAITEATDESGEDVLPLLRKSTHKRFSS